MKNSTGNRGLQKFLLALSLMIVCIGIYLLITTGFSNFVRFGMQGSRVPSTKHQPFLILFIVALLMTFFSGRNLLRRK